MTKPNDDLVSIMLELKEIKNRLYNAEKEMWKQGKLYSESERDYKVALQHRILELKSEGHPVTLILELSKGTEKIANLRFERDLAERRYETCKESIRSLRTISTIMQSALKNQTEW